MRSAQRIVSLIIAGAFVVAGATASAEEEAPKANEESEKSTKGEEAEADGEAAPSPAEIEEAKSAFAKGKEYFDAGELLNAAKMFKRSYKLSKNPILLYNVAFTTDKLEKLDLAISYYEQFLNEAPEAAPNREEATERLDYLRKRKAKNEKEAAAKAARAAKKAKRAGGGFEHNVIEEVPPGKPVNVTAAIPKRARWQVVLYYRVPGMSNYRKVIMKKRYSELVGRVPASATSEATSLQYYVEAKSDGDVVARSGQPTSPNLITVDESAKARFYPDLEDTTESDPTETLSPSTQSGGGEERPDNFWLKWGTTGGAALGIVLGVSFYAISGDAATTLEGEASASTLTDACPDKPCRTYSKTQSDLQSRGSKFETLGHITLGLGVATAAVAGYIWYRDLSGGGSGDEEKKHFDPDDSPLSRAHVAPVVTDDFVGGAALIEF